MRGRPVVGLVLTGGGARAAYQVGVLQALTEYSNGECGLDDAPSLLQDVSVRAGADNIRIRLTRRGGPRLEPQAIYRWMRRALIEERVATQPA